VVRFVKGWFAVTGGDSRLPVIGSPVAERADARRNRLKVLTAAAALFAQHGVAAVSMDDVAAAAGVGKGTLYRRFGDKSGLAAALLDERERQLQEAMLSGPAPLGPGAPPADRLRAFVRSYVAHVAVHAGLVLMSETASPGARLRLGAGRFWHQHCAMLLRAAGAPDPGFRADILLAAMTAEQVGHWQQNGASAAAIGDAVASAAAQLAQPR
jgi:AcrR family transcriptional regulator